MEKILNEINSLNTVMWESAENGNLDSVIFADLFELMSDLIEKLREVAA